MGTGKPANLPGAGLQITTGGRQTRLLPTLKLDVWGRLSSLPWDRLESLPPQYSCFVVPRGDVATIP
ncbi:MAG: hypothetical protein Kow0063_14540 [Anaerolineae bacterium]